MRVIPSSIQPGTLWVCFRDHWHHRGMVHPGSTALLTDVRREDGTVEFVRGGERSRMDWETFSAYHMHTSLERDLK